MDSKLDQIDNILHIDTGAFFEEFWLLDAEVKTDKPDADVSHFIRLDIFSRLTGLFGYLLSGSGVSVLSFLPMGFALGWRWFVFGHHILHGGLEGYASAPGYYNRKKWGRGIRRWTTDWIDCIIPDAWMKNHNVLHHYRLNEIDDPDVLEDSAKFTENFPIYFRVPLVLLGITFWKFMYFVPSIIISKNDSQEERRRINQLFEKRKWSPFHKNGFMLWTRSFIPYVTIRYGFFPLPFYMIGGSSWFINCIINLFLADIVANLYSFGVVVTTHTGDDIYRFSDTYKTKEEYILRSIIGSVNFRTGSTINDHAHGWLNYQIEHHIWPDLLPRAYQRVQPRLKKLCEKYEIPYVQQNVFLRIYKTLKNIFGIEKMRNIRKVEHSTPSEIDLKQGNAR